MRKNLKRGPLYHPTTASLQHTTTPLLYYHPTNPTNPTKPTTPTTPLFSLRLKAHDCPTIAAALETHSALEAACKSMAAAAPNSLVSGAPMTLAHVQRQVMKKIDNDLCFRSKFYVYTSARPLLPPYAPTLPRSHTPTPPHPTPLHLSGSAASVRPLPRSSLSRSSPCSKSTPSYSG